MMNRPQAKVDVLAKLRDALAGKQVDGVAVMTVAEFLAYRKSRRAKAGGR